MGINITYRLKRTDVFPCTETLPYHCPTSDLSGMWLIERSSQTMAPADSPLNNNERVGSGDGEGNPGGRVRCRQGLLPPY